MTAASSTGALLSREQVIAFSGLSSEELRLCEEARLIVPVDGGYRGVELTKAQLVKQVAEHGGGLTQLLARYREGSYSLGYLEMCLPDSSDLTEVTYCQALEEAGIPEDEIMSVLRAAGLPAPSPDQLARPGDLEFLRQYALTRALPIPREAREHAMRITAEGLRRAAEVQSEIFRKHVIEPLLDAYQDDLQKANNLIAEVSNAADPMVTTITAWLFRRYMEHEILRSVTEMMEEAARGGTYRARGTADPVVGFVDLSGFTFVSAEAGDDQAAHLAGHFSDALVAIIRDHQGRVIKMLGDGAMFFFDDAYQAVRASLELVRELPKLGLPAVRAGLNRGPVVAQSGDYYGTTINVAARINDYARPHEVLVSDAVLPDGAAGIELEEIGPVTLKGVPRPVKLFKARESA